MAGKHLFARKSIERLLTEMHGDNRLRRVLGPMSLTSLGVGAIIGAGIFATTGRVAAQDAGPAVVVSYGVAGLGCVFAALCYAEMAAMVPVAGSAYTYTYATLGELFAWIIGWDLVLEYAMSCATVASAWSGHFREFLDIISGGRIRLPYWLMTDPYSPLSATGERGLINLPAVFILIVLTVVLVLGIRESARTNPYWLGTVLAAAQEFPERLEWSRTRYSDNESVTAAELSELAKQYLDPAQVSEVAVGREALPEERHRSRIIAARSRYQPKAVEGARGRSLQPRLAGQSEALGVMGGRCVAVAEFES